MKTKGVPRWYTEYDKATRSHAVRKDGFMDSLHFNKTEALERIVELEGIDAKEGM